MSFSNKRAAVNHFQFMFAGGPRHLADSLWLHFQPDVPNFKSKLNYLFKHLMASTHCVCNIMKALLFKNTSLNQKVSNVCANVGEGSSHVRVYAHVHILCLVLKKCFK